MSLDALVAVRKLHVTVKLPPRERFVLYVLASYADINCNSWPSQSRLALETGYSRQTINKVLADLESKDLAEGQQLRRSDNGFSSKVYRLKLPGLAPNDPPPVNTGLQGVSPRVDTPLSPRVDTKDKVERHSKDKPGSEKKDTDLERLRRASPTCAELLGKLAAGEAQEPSPGELGRRAQHLLALAQERSWAAVKSVLEEACTRTDLYKPYGWAVWKIRESAAVVRPQPAPTASVQATDPPRRPSPAVLALLDQHRSRHGRWDFQGLAAALGELTTEGESNEQRT